MPDASLRGSVDTWANVNKPSQNYAGVMNLKAQSNASMAYVYFARPMPLGALVTEAKLRFRFTVARSGGGTATAHRLAETLQASRVTWNNRPKVVSGGSSTTLRTGGVGTVVEMDVKTFMQQVADGEPWYGFRLQSNSTTQLVVGSAENSAPYRPELYVAWSEEPHAPDPQTPVGGQAVSQPSPVLRFQVTDVLGDTTIASVQVEVASDPDFTTDLWTSAWASTQGMAEVNLAGGNWGWVATTQGTPYYWRVRVRDGAGLESGWSDDAEFQWVPHGTVTILNPPTGDNSFVTEPSPPIIWAPEGGQSQWQVDVTDPEDPATVYASSGQRAGTETAWTVKPQLRNTGPYEVVVRSWDDVYRDPTDPYVNPARQTFTKQDDPTVDGAENLTADQTTAWPEIVLQWTRATAPDGWVVERNGTVITDDEDDVEDFLVEGTTYRFIDPQAKPWRQHGWAVKAVVNGKQSTSAIVRYTPRLRGIWLIDKGRDLQVWLAGNDEGTWTQPEDATAMAPLGSPKVVRRSQGLRNREGSLSGQLVDMYGRTANEYATALENMRKRPEQSITLSVADFSLRVQLGNITTAPTPTNPPGRLVTFDYWEV